MATRTPTPEQAGIIATKLEPGQVMVVNAVAGSGKISTLQMYVDAYPEKKFPYLAFGKAQAGQLPTAKTRGLVVVQAGLTRPRTQSNAIYVES